MPKRGKLPDQLDHGLHVLRVTGTVGEEDPVGLHVQDGLVGGVVGDHGDIAAPGV
jgi:hypothetical protein